MDDLNPTRFLHYKWDNLVFFLLIWPCWKTHEWMRNLQDQVLNIWCRDWKFLLYLWKWVEVTDSDHCEKTKFYKGKFYNCSFLLIKYLSSFAASFPCFIFLQPIMTLHPLLASNFAVSLPMPELPPVISAVLPFKSIFNLQYPS